MENKEVPESNSVDRAITKTPIILGARFIIKVLQEDKAATCSFYELWANNEPLGITICDAREVLDWSSRSSQRDEVLSKAKEMIAQFAIFRAFDFKDAKKREKYKCIKKSMPQHGDKLYMDNYFLA